MDVSVVIPTCNQRDRLALVLAAVEAQVLAAGRYEVVVIDDGSTDGTEALLARPRFGAVRVFRNDGNRGRNRSRNRGVAEARGDLVVFLDGDALPAPDLLQRYLEAHARLGGRSVLCGEQFCLPELEYFQDPRTGSLIDAAIPSVVKDYLDIHRHELVVTERMVRDDFPKIRSRAREGGYPFPELRRRQEQVRDLFTACTDPTVGWLGFVPHNGAVPRALLEASAGFDEEIPFSEGWELAYRLQRYHGASVALVPAVSCHLYHAHAFDDQQGAEREAWVRYRAVEHMANRHADPRIRLLYFWFASLWPDPFIPEEAAVADLIELDARFRDLDDERWRAHQIVLDRHPVYTYLSHPEVLDETAR
jgi:glycosyltransferase involved in cell wall biosynthesis